MKLLRKSLFRLILVLPFVLQVNSAHAQSDPTGSSAVTRTYAVTNATIVQAPGKTIKNGTLVISDGIITAVGTNVDIPATAQVIDGTDHYIYAGFIDGMSYTGASRPESPERPDNLFTPDPPNFYAGITPELSVLDQLDIEESSISNLRKVGFAITHTVPYGRMLPGTGSLILLGDKEHVDDILLKENVSMYTQFVGAPGAYPGNTLGIMAKWRNLYQNAMLSKRNEELYASNPTGLSRPTHDRVLEAFYPVVDKQRPVFYNASSMLEARRAMRLKKQFGFDLALGNLSDAWLLADDLKGTDISVFLSLDLPDEPKNSKDEDKSEEVKALEARRWDFYEKQMSQFHLYDSLGIKFGLSTIDASSSGIKKELVRLGEFGFDSTAALTALTTDAAEILGIDKIAGTLEVGKLGNAVITTGNYFTSDSDIKYMFVDGDFYEYEIKEGGGSSEMAPEAEAALIGTWEYSITSPQGEMNGTIIYSKETGELTGIMTSENGSPDMPLNNLSYNNGSLSFDFAFDAGGQFIEVVVNGDVIGTEFSGEGTISAFDLTLPISASKKDPN